MTTPICDFVKDYTARNPVRLHMPGHKGKKVLGPEALDITEIAGADVLYQSEGVIRESEINAALLFGAARTVYSTEGSSLCIRAMLYLAEMGARNRGRKRARIVAGRNAHRTFIEAAALLDTEICWAGSGEELLSGTVSANELEILLKTASPEDRPTAVYVTSPDYLGNRSDLSALAGICHREQVLLMVDNAHGAYLKFLPGMLHPMELGADICCDSAHKTLPVLTGGAYLHFSKHCPKELPAMAERAMAFFASTSPSWLILQSLDAVNALLADEYPEKIRRTAERVQALKQKLRNQGWRLAGDEPLKLTLCPKQMGYTGDDLQEILNAEGIVSEYSDPDYLVWMITPETSREDLEFAEGVLLALPEKTAIAAHTPKSGIPEPVLSPREASLACFERIGVEESIGRILASPSVSCPPAIPVVICGERIDSHAVELFRYYGIETVDVTI